MVTRRVWLAGGAVGMVAAAFSAPWWVSEPQAAQATSERFEVEHSDAEWRRILTADQYAVLRQSGTERPYSSVLLNEHRRGDFVCAGCDQAVFSSTTKFDSHTGWPSFWAPITNAIATEQDTSFGMVRNAVHCARCGGHLGHVFNDGPEPTGLRYCMNGVAMAFKPTSA